MQRHGPFQPEGRREGKKTVDSFGKKLDFQMLPVMWENIINKYNIEGS